MNSKLPHARLLAVGALTLFASGLLPDVAQAQLPDVAIVAAASTAGAGDPRFTDPQAKLLATGRFGTVDIIDAAITTPDLVALSAYDAVIVWTNASFQSSVMLGDNLADYVDSGGGVVVAVFANSTTTASRFLEGRWITGGYEVVVSQGGNTSGQATLGNVLQPTHPTIQNVNTFDGGTSSFRPTTTTLTTGSTLIAEWSDGKPLVAESGTFGSSRVDLGFYPPSDAVSGSFWNQTTDGDVLMANALEHAAGGGGGNPILSVTGTCPGSMTFQVDNATPTRRVFFAYATGTGAFMIPGSKPCGGTVLGLDNSLQLAGVVNADAGGTASITTNVPAKACGRVFIQAVDEQTCVATNVAGI